MPRHKALTHGLQPTLPVSKRHRVVIVGGEAGGLELAVAIARRPDATTNEVVLIDKDSSQLWKPRLHEVAAGLMNPVEDQVGYFALAQAHGFRFHYDALAGLDLSARTIRLAAVENRAGGEVVLNPREPEYDDLVLAFASQVNDFGIEGVIEHCHFLDSSAQASATFCDQLPDFTQKVIESCKVTRYSFA